MKTSPMLRLLVMGIILMALNVPLTMMCGVVNERTARRNQVAAEVSESWGGAQTVSGPVLSVPYRYSWIDSSGREQNAMSAYHFLPEALEVDGNIDPSERKRSLFSVVVYTAKLKIRGQFAQPPMADIRPAPSAILWDQATISLGVADPRGIARAIDVRWNGQPQRFVPGSSRIGILQSRIQAPAPGMTADRTNPYPFELELELKGTRELRVVPAGKDTTVQLTSSWPHPSFIGTAPDPPRIDASGFAASWRVPYFGRGFATHWKGDNPQDDDTLSRQAAAASFGVALVQPVDIYVQTDRAVKYAVLFIVMTFVIAFAWEITGGVLVHPIQVHVRRLHDVRVLPAAVVVGRASRVRRCVCDRGSGYGGPPLVVLELGARRPETGDTDGRGHDGALRVSVLVAAARGLRTIGGIYRALRHARRY